MMLLLLISLSLPICIFHPSIFLSLFVCVRLSVSDDGVGIFLERLRGVGQAGRSGLPRLCTLVSQNPHCKYPSPGASLRECT